jgi:hypothetical protein
MKCKFCQGEGCQFCRKSKLGNRKTPYNNILYDSKLEAEYAKLLDLRLKGQDLKSWDRQIGFPLIVNKKLIATYKIDFQVTNNDGSIEYIEVKGYQTKDWRLKWKLVQALYPDYKFVLVEKGDF